MKLFRVSLSILLLVGIGTLLSNATTNAPVFTGRISEIGGELCPGDTIYVAYLPPFSPKGLNNFSFKLISGQRGEFQFSLPKYSSLAWMRVDVWHNGKRYSSQDGFLFGQGDRIDLKINIGSSAFSDLIKCSGPGSAKYNAALALSDLSAGTGLGIYRDECNKINLRDSTFFQNKLQKMSQLTFRMIQEKIQKLKTFNLDPTTEEIISLNFGSIYTEWVSRLFAFSTVYAQNARIVGLIQREFLSNNSNFREPITSLAAHAPRAIYNIGLNERKIISLMTDSKDVDVEVLYNQLKNKYSGLVRERLIANLFLGGVGIFGSQDLRSGKFDVLMKEAYQYLGLPKAKQYFLDRLRLAKGTEIFAATFLDSNGRLIGLNSLKGQVVFLDIWGVGCSACAIFHKSFHRDVYPVFRNNPNFIYLSINLDRKPERWKMGLMSGNYSSLEYMNVNTGNLAFDHPFLKYYNIQGSPFMMVINKHHKISIAQIDSDPKALIAAIERALHE